MCERLEWVGFALERGAVVRFFLVEERRWKIMRSRFSCRQLHDYVIDPGFNKEAKPEFYSGFRVDGTFPPRCPLDGGPYKPPLGVCAIGPLNPL